MKQLFIIALLSMFIVTTAFEAPVEKGSREIINKFNQRFNGDNKVIWKSNDNFTEAIFNENGKEVNTFYNNDGELLGTTKVYAFDKLPSNALTTILKRYSYPKYELKACIEYKNADGVTNYYLSLQKKKKKVILEVSPLGVVSTFKMV